MSREHVGVWTGPGVLALIDEEWVHYAPQDVPRDLRARASAFVGMDRPTIGIRRAGGSGADTRERGRTKTGNGETRRRVRCESSSK
ncbi:MAG TPA: hypothetical protein VI337_03625 [Nitrospirales bacterium]|nr:hypothetical protein [Nitrospirales bacterium]